MHKTILAPVVAGEGKTQVLVISDVCLPGPALKIWDVNVIVKDLSGQVCKGNFIFQGILHEQILFINKETDVAQHYQTDIPFSGFIDIPCALPNMCFTFLKVNILNDCGEEKHIEAEGCHSGTSVNNISSSTEHYCCPQKLIHNKYLVEVVVAVYHEEKVNITEHHHCKYTCPDNDKLFDNVQPSYNPCNKWQKNE
ncbi:MAG: DUF3794 domain-containing protein [Clostridia bacterium]|nr:DUF3794 domain-containing protein [Clostridia bacterium]MDD4047854.1 DUF3794 domain-containing protein [Clostridia bacterium]